MANYTGDVELTIDIPNNNLLLKNLTDFESLGFDPGAKFTGYITFLKSPEGNMLYENKFYVLGFDFNTFFSEFSTAEIEIPKLADGTIETGNYVVSAVFNNLYAADSPDNTIDNVNVVKSFSFKGYEKPVIVPKITVDTITPEFIVEDDTDYEQAELGSPVAVDSPIEIIIESSNSIEPDQTGNTSPFTITRYFTGENTVTINKTIQYHLEEANLKLIDDLTITVTENVVCVQDLCSIYYLVDTINKEYQAALETNYTRANGTLLPRLNRATGLLILIRDALSCGNSDGLYSYAEEIKKLSTDCECNVIDPSIPTLIEGLSVFDKNDVRIAYAELADGTGFSFVPTDDSTVIGFLAVNKKYTPVQEDYDGIWIPYAGNSNITEHNLLNGLQGGTPGEYNHLTDDELTQFRGLLFTAPTLELNPSQVGALLEIGDTLNVGPVNINIIVGSVGNVLNDTIYIDGSPDTPIPSSYNLSANQQLTTRTTNVSEVYFNYINPSNLSQVQVLRNVIARADYRVFYFLIPNPLVDMMDPSFTEVDFIELIFQTTPIYQSLTINSELRSNNALGNKIFDPQGTLSKIHIISPVAYGTPKIASQAFPNSPVTTTTRIFNYANGGIVTPYRVTRMDSSIAGIFNSFIQP